MNNAYLAKAKEVITDPQILSIISAKRARQLALGARPMIKCDDENYLDIALLEIANGLIAYDFVSQDEAAAETAGEDVPAENAE